MTAASPAIIISVGLSHTTAVTLDLRQPDTNIGNALVHCWANVNRSKPNVEPTTDLSSYVTISQSQPFHQSLQQ